MKPSKFRGMFALMIIFFTGSLSQGQSVSFSTPPGGAFGGNSSPNDDWINFNVTASFNPLTQRCYTYHKYYAEFYDSGGNYLGKSPVAHTGVDDIGTHVPSGTSNVQYSGVVCGWYDYAPSNTSYVVYGYYVIGNIYDIASGNSVATTVYKPMAGIARWLSNMSLKANTVPFDQTPW